MWFTETPWPPMLIFTVVAMACGWMWVERRQSWWLVGAFAGLALTGGTYVFEQSIVTDREQIETLVVQLATAFQDRDQDETLSYISPRAKDVRERVAWAFLTVTKVEHLRITDTSVEMLAAGSRAKLHFRANGTFHVIGYGDVGHKPTRWRFTWQKEGGLWKVIDVQRLETLTGESMPVEARRQ